MLISCVAYKDGLKLADIGIDEVQNYVSQPGLLVWVALREPDAETLDQLHPLLPAPPPSHYGWRRSLVPELLGPPARTDR